MAECVSHSAIAFFSTSLSAFIFCRFTKPLQLLDGLKGQGKRHISPLNLRPTIYEDKGTVSVNHEKEGRVQKGKPKAPTVWA